jgi:hypothetical protein
MGVSENNIIVTNSATEGAPNGRLIDLYLAIELVILIAMILSHSFTSSYGCAFDMAMIIMGENCIIHDTRYANERATYCITHQLF